MRFTFLSVLAWSTVVVMIGCRDSETSSGPPNSTAQAPEPPEPTLTALDAKAALITLATENPSAFADFPPDPKQLASVDVNSDSEGRFRFGAFLIDPSRLWYSADIEWTGGVHNYRGDFVYRGGKWIANPPELLRFHYPR